MPLVLVADDEPDNRALLHDTFRIAGFAVADAADGDEALELLRRCRPDVAVLDVRMPGRSGVELTRLITGDPALRGTRVVLVSALGEEAHLAAGLEAGADHYVVKPYSPRRLLYIVAELVPGARELVDAAYAGRR